MIFSGQRMGTVPVLDLNDPYKLYGYLWYVDKLDAYGSPYFSSRGVPLVEPLSIEDVGSVDSYQHTQTAKISGTSVAVRSGSSSSWNQATGFYFNWDISGGHFVEIAENEKFTARPYYFDRMYSGAGCTISVNAFNANSNKRPHFKNGVTDSTSGMYFVPLFATPYGLLAPTDWTGLGLVSVASGSTGITANDKYIYFSSEAFVYRFGTNEKIYVPLCGIAVLYDSDGSGSLINTDNLFVGQTDGLFSVSVTGRAVADFSTALNIDNGVTTEYERSFIPFGHKTMSGLKRVHVGYSVVQ